MNYLEFIKSKTHSTGEFGFDPKFYPDCAFDFQKYIIDRAVRKGRMAIFADTGLGKTLIQLAIARNIIEHTNKKVLILTPLAVGFQFVQECKKHGISDDIEQIESGDHSSKIVVCNYERLHYLDPNDFICVMCDESSILKNSKGKTKNQIVSFMRKMPYRYLSTATPSPNDFIELGTSSEALGYMGYMDMLSKFFKNNQNTSDSNAKNIGEKFYLKPHAERDFFAWVNQWAIMVKMPSDLGFSDDGYNLPELHNNHHMVKSNYFLDSTGQMSLFPPVARSMTEVRHEQKMTVNERCERAVELASGKTSVYWVNRNDESSKINELDLEAVEIKGSMSISQKEDILLNFSQGNIGRIITKAKMTGMGLNWQHCNHTVFFPTWSYEQYYQAVRRFWRFGQQNPVTVDMVISEGQTRVLEAINQKTKKAIELYENLVKNTNRDFSHESKEFSQNVLKPNFL